MTERGRRIGLTVFGLGCASVFGAILTFGILLPVFHTSQLARNGIETLGTVTDSFSTSDVRTHKLSWMYVVEYAGHSAVKSSFSERVPVGTTLPILYLADHPDIAAVGYRGESLQVLSERELGAGNSPWILGTFYLLMTAGGIWMASLGWRRART